MKKTLRILAVILAVCLMCTVFTGCDFVDDLEECYAYYNSNGDIVYKDKIYRSLPQYDEINFGNTEDYLNVVEEDTPVLISEMVGEYGTLSENGIFIETTSLYCRQDKYDFVKDKLDNGYEIVNYGYEYDVVDEEEDIFSLDFSYEYEIYEFSDEEVAAVDDVLQNVTPIAEAADNFSNNCEYTIYVSGYDKDYLFMRDCYSILIDKGEYYIEVTDEYYNPIIRKVPQKYNNLFEKLSKKYIDSYDELYWE